MLKTFVILTVIFSFGLSFYIYTSKLKTFERCAKQKGIWDNLNSTCGFLVYDKEGNRKVIIQ